jgi:hypothetical protein
MMNLSALKITASMLVYFAYLACFFFEVFYGFYK